MLCLDRFDRLGPHGVEMQQQIAAAQLPSSVQHPRLLYQARTLHAVIRRQGMSVQCQAVHALSGPALKLQQQARTAVATRAAEAPPGATLQQQELPVGIDPEVVLNNLSRCTNYTQLAALVQSQQEVFLQTPLCVYALLHAVQLRDTLSFEKIGQGSLASEEAVLQQFELVSMLLQLQGGTYSLSQHHQQTYRLFAHQRVAAIKVCSDSATSAVVPHQAHTTRVFRWFTSMGMTAGLHAGGRVAGSAVCSSSTPCPSTTPPQPGNTLPGTRSTRVL